MSKLYFASALLLLFVFAATGLQAMPLHPEIVEKMKREGTLAQELSYMEDLKAKGINNLEGNMVYDIAPGMKLLTVQRQSIVIIVDFDDNTADTGTYPASHFDSLLFSVGTFPTGSMRDYYLENSYGDFEVVGEVSGWHRMPLDYSYYVDGQRGFGDYPRNAQKLTEDAVLAADPYVDFSQYDNDGPDGIPDSGDDDGYVDALFVVHAGPGYETSHDLDDIHSHAWVTSYDVPVDGVLVWRYSQEPESGHIGVFCHELGHVLGVPDFYDYGYDSRGAGYWSVMASGSWGGGGITPVHFDAYSKSMLGFATPIVPSGNLIDVLVPDVETNAVVYKVWTNGSPGAEYFMFENRQQTGFDVSVPGEGIVIYHVDENTYGNDDQRCGSGSPHYELAVEQADGECDLEYYNNGGDAGDPWPGTGGTENPNYAFNLLSTPNTRAYSNSQTGVSIYNIHMEGNDGYVSVAVTEVAPYVDVSVPNGGEVYQIGGQETVRWEAFDDIRVDSVSIYLSIDGGANYDYVLATGEANDGEYLWDVLEPGSETCKVKVAAYDYSSLVGEDVSDGNFEIFDLAGVRQSDFTEFKILDVHPNPTNETTRISFSAPGHSVSAKVFDVTGKVVTDLAPAPVAGDESMYEVNWDLRSAVGGRASTGIYFVRITSGGDSKTARIMVAR
jgi:immune inhibitor A